MQDEALVSYAEKLSKEEARVDWTLSAAQLERCIRAFNPWPMSYIVIDEQPVKIWQASVIDKPTGAEPGTILEATRQGIQVATGDGILNLLSLQPAGKKAMSAQDLLNSRREWFEPGNRLLWRLTPFKARSLRAFLFLRLWKNILIYAVWRPRPLNRSSKRGSR